MQSWLEPQALPTCPATPEDDPWGCQKSDQHMPTKDERFPGEERVDVERIIAKRTAHLAGRELTAPVENGTNTESSRQAGA
ncbi:hypothetical protein N7452_004839 [Penicillium brevicompactum]|uniref:Uncharacterized protein n=1 Tax=Penicillium brevicompactum TaxID=5074 RepID=A0A9W9QHR9_PENBR|nr:hypothetical protein N7452_004839 [Penicillium brevicompactum]